MERLYVLFFLVTFISCNKGIELNCLNVADEEFLKISYFNENCVLIKQEHPYYQISNRNEIVFDRDSLIVLENSLNDEKGYYFIDSINHKLGSETLHRSYSDGSVFERTYSFDDNGRLKQIKKESEGVIEIFEFKYLPNDSVFVSMNEDYFFSYLINQVDDGIHLAKFNEEGNTSGDIYIILGTTIMVHYIDSKGACYRQEELIFHEDCDLDNTELLNFVLTL